MKLNLGSKVQNLFPRLLFVKTYLKPHEHFYSLIVETIRVGDKSQYHCLQRKPKAQKLRYHENNQETTQMAKELKLKTYTHTYIYIRLHVDKIIWWNIFAGNPSKVGSQSALYLHLPSSSQRYLNCRRCRCSCCWGISPTALENRHLSSYKLLLLFCCLLKSRVWYSLLLQKKSWVNKYQLWIWIRAGMEWDPTARINNGDNNKWTTKINTLTLCWIILVKVIKSNLV